MSRADHTPTARKRRRWGLTGLVPALLTLGIAVLLAGCGSGQITQTDTQQSAVNGASGQVGAIAIRNAQLAYPPNAQGTYDPGSSAALWVSIVNTGVAADQLTAVTSPAALVVTIDGTTTGAKALPGGFTIQSGLDVDGLPAASAGSVSSQATSSTSTSAPGAVRIALVGIKSVNGASLRAGMTIPITFFFANAGQVTLNVPIAAPPDGVQYPSVASATTTTSATSSR